MKFTLILLLVMTLNLSAADNDSVAKGKMIYDSVCFACHGKNLEGTIGHNLKDSLWLHGGTKEQIMGTIKKGFPEKGMVAFGAIYNEKQIEDVSNFILSRQEGLRDMEYSIFHNATVETDVKWETQKPNKQAKINPPHINLNLPEVDQYAIRYKGKLLIPKYTAGAFKLKGLVRQSDGFALLIDGKRVDIKLKKNKRFEEKLALSAGSHDIEFRYIKNFKSSTLHLDLKGKASIPLSAESYRRSVTNKHIVKANDSFLIIRKRINDLPPGSIIVNHQDKINYAINPKNGAINAVWSGNSLDIGPNIYARGQKAAAFLGNQLMNKKESIELSVDGAQRELKFIGYSDKPNPKFMYKYGSHEIHIESFLGADGLVLNYSSPSKNSPKIQLNLPKVLNCKVTQGSYKGEVFIPRNPTSFQIIIPVPEKK
jgi:cytochrome c553